MKVLKSKLKKSKCRIPKFGDMILILLVPILTIIYGGGDHYGLWDIISGRAKISKVLERLSNGSGYPVSYIYSDFQDEKDFKTLKPFIEKRTKNPVISKLKKEGHEPTLISVDGGGLIKWDTPFDWPNNITVSKEAQIMFIYNQPRNNPSNEMGKATWVGSIGDVNGWISEEKNNERFYVTVILLTILSLITSILKYKKK